MTRLPLIVSAAVLSACVATWAAQGDQTTRVPSHLLLYGVAFAAYLAALHGSRGLSRDGLRLALGLAIAWRLVLVAAPPLLTDDIHRYVWEGRVQLHGGNPYAWDDRPDAPRWAHLRDHTWQAVTHKEYTAIYPPLWQLAARAVVAVHDSVTAMKAFVVLCELAAWWLLALALRRAALPVERLLVIAWSPLALVEIAGGGHNDALGLMFVAAALLALLHGWQGRAAAALALGVQAKLLPLLLALAWWRRIRVRWWFVAALLGLALLLPYASAGSWLWHSLGKYGRHWRFNETLFAAIAAAAPSYEAALRISALLVVALAGWLGWRRADPVLAAHVVVCAWLLLTPNVLPWYALWLLPTLVLRDDPAALLFTGTVGLAYLVYPAWLSGSRWHVGWDVRALEYLPCAAVATLGLLRRRTGSLA